MATITYDARDVPQLQAGHVAGTQYTITLDLAEFSEIPGSEEVRNNTLAGAVYADLYRLTTQYSVVTTFVPAAGANSLEDLREFVYSCLGGYGFAITLDAVEYPLLFTRPPSITRLGPNAFQLSFLAELVG